MDFAAGMQWPAPVVFALLMHDVGKGRTDQSAWPSHVGHEARGVPLVERVCERLRAPGAWRDLAVKVCALHLRCHQLSVMRPTRIMALIEEADLLRRPDQAEPFLQACEADYRGRKDFVQRPYPQAQKLTAALQAARSIQARELDTEGLEGPEIGRKVREARVEAIALRLATADGAGPAS
jgi:tRNA nucleotidyltransferase (CCA-adding enzyme)